MSWHDFITWHDWPDVRDWLATISTAGAAIFAAWTIRQAHRLAAVSANAALAERRIDHDLTILRALAEAAIGPDWHTSRALVNMTDLKLPYTRGAVDKWASDVGSSFIDGFLASKETEVLAANPDALKGMNKNMVRTMWAQQAVMGELADAARELIRQRPSIT